MATARRPARKPIPGQRFRLEFRRQAAAAPREWRIHVEGIDLQGPTAVRVVADLRAQHPKIIGHPVFPHVVDVLGGTRDPIELVPYACFTAPEDPSGWTWLKIDGDSDT